MTGSTAQPSELDLALDAIERCYELGWSDGLPVVPPTRSRVERMLGEHAGRRDEVVAVLPPAGGVATLEKVAANAVLAGCLPEYLPVVEAALRAMADERFWLDDMVTAIDHMSPLLLVGGPLAAELGMNGEAGALGPGSRANATIGRAVNLCLRNLAGARPIGRGDDGLDGATIGHPGKYTYCYTESPLSPWEPLHVALGHAPDDSVVIAYPADAPLSVCEMTRSEPELILNTVCEALASPGTFNAYLRDLDLWLILSPEHALQIAAAGWSRADVQRYVHEHARLTSHQLVGRGIYGLMDDVWRPAWMDRHGPDEPVPICRTPEQVLVSVAGAPYGGYTAICFGFGSAIHERIGGPR